MFHSAAIKLTLWYLAIIMVISLGFTMLLYRISSREINRSLRPSAPVYGFVEPGQLDEYEQYRQDMIALARHHLEQNLVLFNLFVLVLGGIASYVLARRTLTPIEEAMESQSRFTADASHELRTPLTAMRTGIEVALRDPNLTREQAVELLGSNLEEVDKLKNLADGLLQLTRAEGNGVSLSAVAMHDVVDEAGRRVKAAAARKRIKLETSVNAINVRGEEQTLIQLLVILLDNAIKYSPAKTTVTVRVNRVRSRPPSRAISQAQLQVIDQGYGIKAADLPHIFDRFYRIDSSRSKEQTEGYGLGLSIAKRIVELHHGTIRVKSQPDNGTTFTIRLPLA